MPFMQRSAAEQFFGPYFEALRDVVVGADDDYKNHYTPAAKVVHDPTCRAKNRSCHMIDRANKLAAMRPRKIKSFDSQGLQGIVIEDRAAVIFKKMDGDLRTRNNMTDHIEDYLRQQPIDGIEALHYFVVGYTEDQITGEITGVYMTYPNGRGVYYYFTLSAGAEDGIVEDLFPPEPPSDEPPMLKPKTQPGEVVKFPKKKDDERKP